MISSSLRSLAQAFVTEPLRDLWRPAPGQLGSLDFLRSCAVLMVILYHLQEGYLASGGSTSLLTHLPLIKYGFFGVDLFFVLSGYLIGKQLWRELAASGTIQIPRFLLRRGLRIWPLYYTYLGLMMVMPLASYYRHADAVWWSDAFYLSNYSNRGLVDGSWSLCTEEQFYLVLPVLLLVTWSSALFRQRSWWLWGILLLLPLIRLAEWRCGTGDWGRHNDFFIQHMSFPIHARCDGLFAGVLIAWCETRSSSQFAKSWLASPWMAVVAIGLGGLLCGMQRWIFCYTAASWVFAAVTAYLVARPGFLKRFFNSPVFYWLSRLSFGMYLNHMYLFEPLARWSLAHLPGSQSQPFLHLLITEVLLVVASAAVAVVTYAVIEHPFLVLRDTLLRKTKPAALPALEQLVRVSDQVA
jgi:peptidoglycan/LPS O-acetylase OafA/YrhL